MLEYKHGKVWFLKKAARTVQAVLRVSKTTKIKKERCVLEGQYKYEIRV